MPPLDKNPQPDTNVLLGLDEPRITLDDIGSALGIARPALEKYREGRRRVPPDLRPKLADFLRTHAAQLVQIADLLDEDHADEQAKKAAAR